MSISNFDRVSVRDFRAELIEALEVLAAKHDISFDVGRITFNNDSARMKLTATTNAPALNFVNPVMPTSSSVHSGSVDPAIDAIATANGLPVGLKGRKVKHYNTVYTIDSVKPSRYKYPFMVIGPQGGRYKMSVAQIREGLD
jgi:hypothetical protein